MCIESADWSHLFTCFFSRYCTNNKYWGKCLTMHLWFYFFACFSSLTIACKVAKLIAHIALAMTHLWNSPSQRARVGLTSKAKDASSTIAAGQSNNCRIWYNGLFILVRWETSHCLLRKGNPSRHNWAILVERRQLSFMILIITPVNNATSASSISVQLQLSIFFINNNRTRFQRKIVLHVKMYPRQSIY